MVVCVSFRNNDIQYRCVFYPSSIFEPWSAERIGTDLWIWRADSIAVVLHLPGLLEVCIDYPGVFVSWFKLDFFRFCCLLIINLHFQIMAPFWPSIYFLPSNLLAFAYFDTFPCFTMHSLCQILFCGDLRTQLKFFFFSDRMSQNQSWFELRH